MNAARAGKKALCMLTISDHIYRQEGLSAMERQIGFGKMMEIALELADSYESGEGKMNICLKEDMKMGIKELMSM